MWWSSGRALSRSQGAALAVLMFVVAGCGFHPLYSQDDSGGGTTPQLAKVSVGEPVAPLARRTAQLVRNNLQDRLTPGGLPDHPLYLLQLTLDESEQALALTRAEEATRIDLILNASYKLIDLRSNKVLHSRNLRTISSFSRLRADFGNVSAENDARARAARELAEEIRIELASWLGRFVPEVKQ